MAAYCPVQETNGVQSRQQIPERFRMVSYVLVVTISLLISFSSIAYAAVYHVSMTGTKTSGASIANNWSDANCYQTISSAIGQMSGGDEVIVDDGTYSGCSNVIGRYGGACGSALEVPSGSAGNYTKIKARNDFQVTIDSGESGDWDYRARMVYIGGTTSYVEISGINGINRDGSNNLFVEIKGNHIKFMRSLLRTGQMHHENNVLSISGDTASYVLVEDVAMVGAYRYGFTVMGYANDADTNMPNHIIFRRCVFRGDWSSSDEPISGFAVYGHNGEASRGPHHISYQNVIAIDNNPVVPEATSKAYSPFYFFKGNRDISITGSIILNADTTGSTSGPYVRNEYGGNGLNIDNTVIYEVTPAPLTVNGDGLVMDRLTIGGSAIGYDHRSPAGTLTNSLFVNNITENDGGSGVYATASHNSFDSLDTFGSNQVPYEDDLTYLPRVDKSSNRATAGSGGGLVGANIIYQTGVSGTLWGEPGWNSETDVMLWPWPHEDAIRDWFAVPNPPINGKVNASPQTNDTTRGFTDSAHDHSDHPLTEYIWEYLGNEIGNTNEEIEAFDFAAGYIPDDPRIICYLDGDGDGYSNGANETVSTCSANYYTASQLTAIAGDCNDSEAGINPGAEEIAGNGIDEDCSGADLTLSIKAPFIHLDKVQ